MENNDYSMGKKKNIYETNEYFTRKLQLLRIILPKFKRTYYANHLNIQLFRYEEHFRDETNTTQVNNQKTNG